MMTDRQRYAAVARVLLEDVLPMIDPGLEPTRKRALELCARVEGGDEDLAGDAITAVANVLFSLADAERAERQGRAAA